LLKPSKGTKGLSAPPIKNKVALRTSLTGSIFMDSVRVGHDALLPHSKGLGSAFSCLNNARFGFVLFHPCLLARLLCLLSSWVGQVWHLLGRDGRIGGLSSSYAVLRARTTSIQETACVVPVGTEEIGGCTDGSGAWACGEFSGEDIVFSLSLVGC
jgi:hypothetical protein